MRNFQQQSKHSQRWSQNKRSQQWQQDNMNNNGGWDNWRDSGSTKGLTTKHANYTTVFHNTILVSNAVAEIFRRCQRSFFFSSATTLLLLPSSTFRSDPPTFQVLILASAVRPKLVRSYVGCEADECEVQGLGILCFENVWAAQWPTEIEPVWASVSVLGWLGVLFRFRLYMIRVEFAKHPSSRAVSVSVPT